LVASLVTVGALAVFALGDDTTREAAAIAAVGLAAAYVTMMHPLAIFRAFAIVLGFVPFAYLPGTRIQIILILCLGIWVALAFLPDVHLRLGWPEYAVAVFLVVAALSVVVTGVSADAIKEYAAWAAPTAAVVPLRFLPADRAVRVVRTFVVSAGIAAGFGILLLIVDPTGALLGTLTFAGYRPDEFQARFVFGSNGATLRLAGTLVEPNVAGIVLAAAMMLALAYFSGAGRVMLVGLTGAAMLLTLSRTAVATAAVAGLLLLARVSGRQRLALAGVGLGAGLASLLIPTVRNRLLDSFGPSDSGTQARLLAFGDFPDVMAGHWLWGLGWVREEFREALVTFTVNPVANTVLITIYRAGLIVGLVGLVILVILIVRSWWAMRGDFTDHVIGATVLAFCLVALQLDVPVAFQAPGTALFSFLVALLIRDKGNGNDRGLSATGGHRP
jgi:hypothetical protein